MADTVKVTWGPGLQALMEKFQERPEAMRKAMGTAAYMEGEETISDAKPLVPVLHGGLVNSGFCGLPESQGDVVSVTFGFGGVAGSGNQGGVTNEGDVGYAIYVHEDMTKHHPHGQAKFLEDPLNARKSDMSDRLAGRIEDALPK